MQGETAPWFGCVAAPLSVSDVPHNAIVSFALSVVARDAVMLWLLLLIVTATAGVGIGVGVIVVMILGARMDTSY